MQSKQLIIRISDTEDKVNRSNARRLAGHLETMFRTDGSNITFGTGRWKGKEEFSAAIEIVVPAVDGRDLDRIRDIVVSLGQEAMFYTIADVEAGT